MTTAQIQLPPKLIPVFMGEARYRGAYGGRGSAKTRSFAKMTAVRGYQWSRAGESGVIVCGREFMNSLDESSLAEVKAAIRSEPWLDAHYEIGEKFVRTRDGLIEYKFIGLRHNLESIKSKARVRLLWVDEAEPLSEAAWRVITPSVREDDSEIWLTWNPKSRRSATNKRFRGNPPPNSKIVELNYRDNPWFPAVLEAERQADAEKRPEAYGNIWEGEYETVATGAYFAAQLTALRTGSPKRLGNVAADPLMRIRTFWDLGVSDSMAIWVAQFVGREIRVLDYCEGQGQPLSYYVEWLRSNGYGNALCVLPHDGAERDSVRAVKFEDHLREAEFEVQTVKNQGKGAALLRIEAVRRLFPQIWINEATTEDGMEALAAYHERLDPKRETGFGPEHDWASHGADAFGLMCVAYEEPAVQARERRQSRVGVQGGWMR